MLRIADKVQRPTAGGRCPVHASAWVSEQGTNSFPCAY